MQSKIIHSISSNYTTVDLKELVLFRHISPELGSPELGDTCRHSSPELGGKPKGLQARGRHREAHTAVHRRRAHLKALTTPTANCSGKNNNPDNAGLGMCCAIGDSKGIQAADRIGNELCCHWVVTGDTVLSKVHEASAVGRTTVVNPNQGGLVVSVT